MRGYTVVMLKPGLKMCVLNCSILSIHIYCTYHPHRGLDMSKYMAEGTLKDTKFSGNSPVYDLYATVNHFGSVFFGHYMSYIKPHENDGELLACVRVLCIYGSVY